MADPITVDIPHRLGRAQAHERIDKGVGQIAAIVPGSAIRARHWDGDALTFTLESFGQRITSKIEVFDDSVRITVDLPPILALAAQRIREQLGATGTKLLR
jgi:hypothetical protein